MFDGDAIVEIHDWVDGTEGRARLEEASVERLVRLGILFGVNVVGTFERVAVQCDARVGLRFWVLGEGGEGFGRCFLDEA